MTGPESVVLPLHHSPIWFVVVFDTAKVEYYFYSAKKKTIFFLFYAIFFALAAKPLSKRGFLGAVCPSFLKLLFADKHNRIGRYSLLAALKPETLGSGGLD